MARSAWRHWKIPILAGVTAISLLSVGLGVADVLLLYQGQSKVTGASSPFRFVNGGNYAAANAQGLSTNTYPNTQQVSVSASVTGINGAYGTYLLDVLELQPNVTSAATWHLRVDTTTALVATGVNAAYVFVCTSAPTTVPDTGAPVASGTDVRGNPWAIFAPTCAGSQYGDSLTAVTAGTSQTFVGVTAGTSLLYLSFALAVTNTGAATTTPASLTFVATTP
ncbi:MAG: hypothetical protein L3K19_04610 [Thermoplasmata archaeon]|nr:hypothetical protein [Thermoplasmata archaeon]